MAIEDPIKAAKAIDQCSTILTEIAKQFDTFAASLRDGADLEVVKADMEDLLEKMSHKFAILGKSIRKINRELDEIKLEFIHDFPHHPYMHPELKPLTPVQTPIQDVRMVCSACGKEFKFLPAYGGNSKRAAYTYLMTRFHKHVSKEHQT